MVMSWPTPYYKRFSKKEPGNPFATLLDDEETTKRSIHTSSKKEKLETARKLLLEARRIINKHIKELTEQGTTEGVGLVEQAKELKALITTALWVEKRVSDGAVIPKGELVVLSSSWLSNGVISFHSITNKTLSQGELVTILHTLVSKVNYYLNSVLDSTLSSVAALIRKALLLIPTDGDTAEEEAGVLTITIIKRKYPSKRYGPYSYPNVRKSTWERMKVATGMKGQGAGTIFWREYLDFQKNRKGIHA